MPAAFQVAATGALALGYRTILHYRDKHKNSEKSPAGQHGALAPAPAH